MLPLIQLMTPVAAVENITMEVTWFGNGKSSALVDFQSAGFDDSNNLSLQSGLYVDEAKLKISTLPQAAGSTAYPTNLTVDFGGDRKVEWQWRGQGYGQFGRQTAFKNGKDIVNMTLGSGQYNDTLSIRLPKTADIRSARMNISVAERNVGTPGKILIIYATGYTDCNTDIVNKLMAFSNDFTTVDTWNGGTSTPTYDDIKDYWSVMLWNHVYNGYRWADANTLGNTMAQYVDAGGGVVCFLYLWQGGWNGQLTGNFNSNYYCWGTNINSMSCGSTLSWGSVQQPTHPVLVNVSRVDIPGQMWTSSVALNPGASTVFTWGNSAQGCAVMSVGGVDRVDIQMVPYSSSASYPTYSCGWSGDGDDLIRNSLLFAGRKPFTGTIDILNDTNLEFNETDYQGNLTFDLAQQLRDYLATANISYTDPFGNAFVDIPINVTAAKPGLVRFDNLEVLYDYTTDIERNLAAGDLVSSLADLQSSVISMDNSSIPLVVSSETAGQAKLHDLYLKLTPPVHKPTINSFYPAATTIVKENSQLDFGIDVVDWYGNPMTIKWFSDEVEVPDSNTTTFSRAFDYESAGNHTVKVAINNGLSTAVQVWALTVLNVNRAPTLVDFFPAADPTIDENTTQALRVNATDPDKDPLTYKWTLNGKAQPAATCNTFLFYTDFLSAGDHTVKVTATDPGGLWAGRNWTIHVENVNLPPVFTAWSPKTNPRILERESWQFSVTPYDPDGQTLTTTWYVDDAQAFVGNPFVYTTDYKSAGIHKIRASVSDGKETTSRTWDITVINVNRVPVAIIDAPTESEFMEKTSIHFSAVSSYDADNEKLIYSWREGNVNVSDQVEFDRIFPPGLHTLTLEVRDQSGGVSSASVRFRVRFVEISVLIGMDKLEVVAGDKTDIIVTMSNVGDATAEELTLEVLVDGKSIGTKSYAEIAAGGGIKEVFAWKATRGQHTITATAGEQSWTKEVTVQKAPEATNAMDYGAILWPLIIVIVAVALVAFGAVVLRKK